MQARLSVRRANALLNSEAGRGRPGRHRRPAPRLPTSSPLIRARWAPGSSPPRPHRRRPPGPIAGLRRGAGPARRPARPGRSRGRRRRNLLFQDPGQARGGEAARRRATRGARPRARGLPSAPGPGPPGRRPAAAKRDPGPPAPDLQAAVPCCFRKGPVLQMAPPIVDLLPQALPAASGRSSAASARPGRRGLAAPAGPRPRPRPGAAASRRRSPPGRRDEGGPEVGQCAARRPPPSPPAPGCRAASISSPASD